MIATTALAIMALAQQAGGSIEAVYPDDPTTWTLEYPVRIQPQVSAYYNCLRSGSYVVGGDNTFEAQYREDLPRCAKKGMALQSEANTALARNDEAEATPPEEVEYIFDRARRIHIARGQSLDLAIQTRLNTDIVYNEVEALDDVSTEPAKARCVVHLENLINQRRVYVEAEALRIEAAEKQLSSAPQQRTVVRYQNQLRLYDGLISSAQNRCPQASNPTPPQDL